MCPPPSGPSDRSAGIAERSFPARASEVRNAVEFVATRAAAAGLDPARAPRLMLAVEEAVANVCNHAYGVEGGDVVVRVATGPQEVRVEVEDAGAAFDPLALAPPDLVSDLDERPLGGLGVHLLRQVMDEIAYRREGDRNVLTLVMRR